MDYLYSGPKEAKDVMIADKISKLMKLKLNHFIQPEPKLSLEYFKKFIFLCRWCFSNSFGRNERKRI